MPRASKQQKDPNAPKRPLSAFFIFSQDERPKIKVVNASLSVADVAKVIGEKWRAAPDDLKRKYEKAAKEAKERYEVVLQAYKQTRIEIYSLIIFISILFFSFLAEYAQSKAQRA
jgi:hypothetical protein